MFEKVYQNTEKKDKLKLGGRRGNKGYGGQILEIHLRDR